MTLIEPGTEDFVVPSQDGKRTAISEPALHQLVPELAKDMRRKDGEGPRTPIVEGSIVHADNAEAFDGHFDAIRAARQAVEAAHDTSRTPVSTLPSA